MTSDLTEQVESALAHSPHKLGFAIVSGRVSDSFNNALVVAQSGDVRIRIVRDRDQVFADLGSAAEPDTWFDSAVVMDALGLTRTGGFGGRDVEGVLTGLLAFLKSVWPELLSMFGKQRFVATKRRLSEVQDLRAAKRWGD